MKSIQIQSYFWSLFSCIQTECRKIPTRNNSVFGYFSRSERYRSKIKWQSPGFFIIDFSFGNYLSKVNKYQTKVWNMFNVNKKDTRTWVVLARFGRIQHVYVVFSFSTLDMYLSNNGNLIFCYLHAVLWI